MSSSIEQTGTDVPAGTDVRAGTDVAADRVVVFDTTPVSYTHLTLPTNREV